MSRLIVNADDFGLTSGVNRAIVELHRAGVLTSTTLMAKAAATDEAIELGRSTPSLGVGCHVVLVDGVPVLPSRDVPSLVDAKTGCFPPRLTTFLRRLFTGRVRAAEIEAEAAAQIALLQSRGLRLTHIDTHKHTHMFPRCCGLFYELLVPPGFARCAILLSRSGRYSATPRASLRAQCRGMGTEAIRALFPADCLRRRKHTTTEGTIAVAATGVVNADTVRSLLARLPAGTWELVTHPGYNDADLDKIRTRLRTSRDVERNALQAIREFPAVQLITFGDLEPAAGAARSI